MPKSLRIFCQKVLARKKSRPKSKLEIFNISVNLPSVTNCLELRVCFSLREVAYFEQRFLVQAAQISYRVSQLNLPVHSSQYYSMNQFATPCSSEPEPL